jgi:hypothetical protein
LGDSIFGRHFPTENYYQEPFDTSGKKNGEVDETPRASVPETLPRLRGDGNQNKPKNEVLSALNFSFWARLKEYTRVCNKRDLKKYAYRCD